MFCSSEGDQDRNFRPPEKMSDELSGRGCVTYDVIRIEADSNRPVFFSGGLFLCGQRGSISLSSLGHRPGLLHAVQPSLLPLISLKQK